MLSADLAANRDATPMHIPYGCVCVCVCVGVAVVLRPVGVAGQHLPPQLIARDKFRVSSLAF